MTPPFAISATPHYERLFQKLLKHHPDLVSFQESANEILRTGHGIY